MKINILLLSLLMSSASVYADDISIGYCDGGIVEGSLSGVESVAVSLDKDEFCMYHGSVVTGVRIGLASDAPKGLDVFVRSGLDGEDLVSYRTGVLYRGWNDVVFDTPVEYPASDVAVGYDVPAGVLPGLSAIYGLESANSCWGHDGIRWTDHAADGSAPVCIQLLVDGSSYTKNDAALLSVDDVTVDAGKAFSISGFIRNNTNMSLTSVRMACDMGGRRMEADAVVDDVLPGETGRFSLPLEGEGTTGVYEVELEVLTVAGADDDFSFNNKASCTVGIVGEIVPRTVLIEEFTGQDCPNCPAGQDRLSDALKGLDNVVTVAHHIGYYPDDFTVAGSDRLLFFYNDGGSTYAPAMMMDRQGYDGTPGPVGEIKDSKTIRRRIEDRMNVPAEVSVSILRDFDIVSRSLTVEVSVRRIAGMRTGDNPVLNVYLVENGIVAFQRPNYDYYKHNHVNRMFVTSPLGDSLELDEDETLTSTFNVSVDEAWDAENMEIVAFVSNHDESDCNNCSVYNAVSVPLVGKNIIGDSTDMIHAGAEAEVEGIYGITGLRRDSLKKGINIIRYTDGTAVKVFCDKD